MLTTVSQNMGQVTTTIAVTNFIDEMLAEQGFLAKEEGRSVTFIKVLEADDLQNYAANN